MMLEHPDITKALRTGHPIDWKEPEPICCPICGAENPDKLYRFRDDRENRRQKEQFPPLPATEL